MPQDKPPSRLWKWTRRVFLTLFILLSLGLLAGWGYIAWANANGRREAQAALAELRQRKLPTSREELLAASPAAKRPPGGVLYAAFELAGGAKNQYYDLWPDTWKAGLAQPIPPESARQFEQFMSEYKLYFELLDQARQVDARLGLIDWPASRTGGVMTAVHHRLTASLAAQANGQADQALGHLNDALWACSTVDGQPGLALAAIRGGWHAHIHGGIEQCLARVQPRASALRELRDALEREQKAWSLREAARGEVAVAAECLGDVDVALARQTHGLVSAVPSLEQAKGRFVEVMGDARAPFIPGPWDIRRTQVRRSQAIQWTWLYLCPGAYQSHFAHSVRKCLADLTLTEKDEAELIERARSDDDSPRDDSLFTPRGLNMLLRARTLLLLAVAGISVELHRVQHGDWPADLSEVEGSMPTDPFTGKPFIYTRTSDGVEFRSSYQPRGPGESPLRFRLFDPALRGKAREPAATRPRE